MPSSGAYSLGDTHTIPARSSVAVPLSVGQKLTVINTHGSQVIDFWTFKVPEASSELTTYLSMSHTRAGLAVLSPVAPCTLFDNKRKPILKFLSDTSGCIHDTLMAACDIHRYRELGVPEDQYHENCADNLRRALERDAPGFVLPAPFNTPLSAAPEPLNLFMNIPVHLLPTPFHSTNKSAGGKLTFEPTISGKGSRVVFEAVVDCIVAMSCCPQDLLPINGGTPVECHFVVEG